MLKVVNRLIDEVNSGRFDLGVGPGTGAPAKEGGETPTPTPSIEASGGSGGQGGIGGAPTQNAPGPVLVQP
jgi:hypothetical protein